jgi:murein DD-endopeptidase MepM/ murein hydrolase activator NlpD
MLTVIGLMLLGVVLIRRKVEWGDPALWTWPVPDAIIGGQSYPAVISDGVGTDRPEGKSHRGVDIMYRRKSSRDLATRYAPKTSNGTPGHIAPPFTPIVAARAGTVWSVANTPRGWTVVISHDGTKFATYYTHLESVALPAHKAGVSLATGKPTVIGAGDYIGAMGWDPKDASKTRHLHFAVWESGPESHAVDPEAAMRSWSRVPWQWDPDADNEKEDA